MQDWKLWQVVLGVIIVLVLLFGCGGATLIDRTLSDTDQDGLINLVDNCNEKPGPVGRLGCPAPVPVADGGDTDGDGETDGADVAGDQRFFGAEGDDARIARLIELDAIYRSQGWQAWLKAAGVTCDVNVEARQPEEETVVYNGETRIVISGLQVDGHCEVPYPAIVTTGDPSVITIGDHTRQYQPDLTNPSVIYTNVTLDGDGTIWIDGSNWGQLDPTS